MFGVLTLLLWFWGTFPRRCSSALLRAPAPEVKAFVVSEGQGLPGHIVFLRRPSSPAESKPSLSSPHPLPTKLPV